MYELVFVNRDAETLRVYKEILGSHLNNTSFEHGDIQQFKNKCSTFVSASNSRLYFDGGSDLAYEDIFPDVHKHMLNHLERFWRAHPGVFSDQPKAIPHLPVGAGQHKCLITTDGRVLSLISVPTMILPGDVQNTRNAYIAFKMVLELLDKTCTTGKVLVPGLCTGIGLMSAEISAAQILEAYNDHKNGRRLDVLLPVDTDFVFNPTHMQEQPKGYRQALGVR